MVERMPLTGLSAFDHFAGLPQGLCEVVCFCEFYLYLFGVVFVFVFLIGLAHSVCVVGKVSLLNMFNMLVPVLNAILFYISKVGDCSQGQPKGSLFNRYNTDV